MTCGIYCIKNIDNGKVYIGQSINVENRKETHKYYLKNNSHQNTHLQNSFNKYGIDKFKFIVLKKCDEKELDYFEKKFIAKNNSDNPKYGYNIESGGKKGKGVSEETKIKRSIKTNTTGYYRVSIGDYTYKNGLSLIYSYHDKGELKNIKAYDIKELEKKVKARGLRWMKLDNNDNISNLIKKYSKKQKGEKWSSETDKNYDEIRGLNDKLRLFDGINGEYFRIKGTKKERVKYLLKNINFNEVCPRCSNEQMIVIICYYVNCEYNAYYNRKNCGRVFKDYNISNNLVDRFMLYMAKKGIEGTRLDKKFFENGLNQKKGNL